MAVIEITAVNNGGTVLASPGDVIVVVLAENPTTGYRWYVDRADDALRLVSDGYRQVTEADNEEPVFGRGGLREFRFEVMRSGTATLLLKHGQEWEGDSSVTDRFAIVINAVPSV